VTRGAWRGAGEAAAESRPCPLCGTRVARRREDLSPSSRVIACPSCRLLFVDPIPEAALSSEAYGHDYYEPWQGREERPRSRMWRRRMNQIEAHHEKGSILDVGCGDGHFLSVARQASWKVDGIEFSPEGARRAALRLGRPVAVGDLSRTAHLSGPFDVITLWHVLEHLESPRAMLEAARQRLRHDGLLAVAVPNVSNLPMQAAYLLARGRKLPLYEPGAREPHLSHFTPETLTALLRRSGFEVREIAPDLCALTPAKRLIDLFALALTRCAGRIVTDAIVAFARRMS
jgi:2-polyprenyl-3-methyl-5-hydroxy-6-metoxy-1,4-benzoquinol methylase